jgi:hypothetical protein
MADPALDALIDRRQVEAALGVLSSHYAQFAPHVQRVLFL